MNKDYWAKLYREGWTNHHEGTKAIVMIYWLAFLGSLLTLGAMGYLIQSGVI